MHYYILEGVCKHQSSLLYHLQYFYNRSTVYKYTITQIHQHEHGKRTLNVHI